MLLTKTKVSSNPKPPCAPIERAMYPMTALRTAALSNTYTNAHTDPKKIKANKWNKFIGGIATVYNM